MYDIFCTYPSFWQLMIQNELMWKKLLNKLKLISIKKTKKMFEKGTVLDKNLTKDIQTSSQLYQQNILLRIHWDILPVFFSNEEEFQSLLSWAFIFAIEFVSLVKTEEKTSTAVRSEIRYYTGLKVSQTVICLPHRLKSFVLACRTLGSRTHTKKSRYCYKQSMHAASKN